VKILKRLSVIACIVLAVSFGTSLYISSLNDKAIAEKSKTNITAIIDTKNRGINELVDEKQPEEERKKEEAKLKAEEEEKNKLEEDKKRLEEEIRVKKELEEKLKAEQEAKQKEESKAKQEQAKLQTNKSQPSNAQNSQPQTKAPSTQASNKSASSVRQDIPLKYAFEYLQNIEDQILVLCNQERAKVGVKPLVMNETLRQSSRYKSNEMLQYNYFDHASPVNGFNPWDLAKTFGYSYTAFGENIWYGSGYSRDNITAKLIVDAWLNSSGHKKNILNQDFGRIGVGIVYSGVNKKLEATQQFSD
jgi:uncharacterized protein YkwD